MLNNLDRFFDLAAGKAGGKLAVAACHDRDVLLACIEAETRGLCHPILIGDGQKTAELLCKLGHDPAAFEIITTPDDVASAAMAVSLVREGKANAIMKGLLQTGDLMRAVINKETGIRTGRLLSHVMVYECPGCDRLLYLTDGGMNTFPTLDQKAEILENAAQVLHKLGYTESAAACICGAEAVNPKIQSTLDAQALSEMTDRWTPYGLSVYGPVGLDLAISPHAVEKKKYNAPGAGRADILLVPNYEVGNGIGKAMTYFGNARSAGVIVGAACPIVLVSRADSFETKLLSIAMAAAISPENR
ncbi:MAG: phosphate butyryltransferase [Clostridia bacterium]|nr:phosphate butyryltransferase [Clostridia bacterium]